MRFADIGGKPGFFTTGTVVHGRELILLCAPAF
jgi:hypothetical protein